MFQGDFVLAKIEVIVQDGSLPVVPLVGWVLDPRWTSPQKNVVLLANEEVEL